MKTTESYLVVLGAGAEQIPLYQKARALGYRVAGTDVNPQAPALEYADKTIIASSRHPKQILQAVDVFNNKHEVKGVLTFANGNIETVAKICNQLNLNGPSEETARICQNKYEQIQILRKAGIKVPRTQKITDVKQLEKLIGQRYRSGIIKPATSRKVGAISNVETGVFSTTPLRRFFGHLIMSGTRRRR